MIHSRHHSSLIELGAHGDPTSLHTMPLMMNHLIIINYSQTFNRRRRSSRTKKKCFELLLKIPWHWLNSRILFQNKSSQRRWLPSSEYNEPLRPGKLRNCNENKSISSNLQVVIRVTSVSQTSASQIQTFYKMAEQCWKQIIKYVKRISDHIDGKLVRRRIRKQGLRFCLCLSK